MDANSCRAPIYVFGDCELDTERCELRRHGVAIRLRPKSFEVLQFLVVNAGRLLSKRELLDAVWGRRAVTEDSVAQCIVEIRRAIGSGTGGPCLRTLPRRGYLLDVTAQASARPSPSSEPPPGPPRPASWRASLRPARIAGRLFVLLAASLAVSSSWHADERALGATATAGADRPAARNAAPGREAFELGMHLFHRRLPGDLIAAERQLQRALALDPADADAWTALAGVYAARGFEEQGDATWRLADQRSALERALEINPNHAEALVRLSRVLYRAGDARAAAVAAGTASRIAPDHPLVLYERVSDAVIHGRLDEAIELQWRAVRDRPLSAIYRINLGSSLLGAGRHAEALAQLRRAQLLAPQASLESAIARALVADEQISAARQHLQTVPAGMDRDQLLAMIATDVEQARAAQARLEERGGAVASLLLAEIAAHRGASDLALQYLREAVTLANGQGPSPSVDIILNAAVSPFLGDLRSDPRWPWRAGAPASSG